MKKGIIFEVKRFAVHDGDGIRTTVFLKGCPLNCVWCHNPEGISSRKNKYIECCECATVCSEKAHSIVEEKHFLCMRGVWSAESVWMFAWEML